MKLARCAGDPFDFRLIDERVDVVQVVRTSSCACHRPRRPSAGSCRTDAPITLPIWDTRALSGLTIIHYLVY